jgi:hypothetical protein
MGCVTVLKFLNATPFNFFRKGVFIKNILWLGTTEVTSLRIPKSAILRILTSYWLAWDLVHFSSCSCTHKQDSAIFLYRFTWDRHRGQWRGRRGLWGWLARWMTSGGGCQPCIQQKLQYRTCSCYIAWTLWYFIKRRFFIGLLSSVKYLSTISTIIFYVFTR